MVGNALRRFVLAGSGNAVLIQRLTDFTRAISFPRQFKNQPDIGGCFLVRLHAAISAFLVAIGTELALILAPPELHILGALVLDGQIPAIKLTDQILERHIDAACVSVELIAVKIIVDGNEADTVQRENHFHKVPDLNAVAPEPGEVLHDDAVDLALPHMIQQVLDGWPLKIGPAISVVDELQNFRVFNTLHSVNVLVECVFLILNAETAHLAVLGGEPDIEGNHIADRAVIHSPAPLAHAQSRFQRKT